MPDVRLLALAPGDVDADGELLVGWAQATIPGQPYQAWVDQASAVLTSLINWFESSAIDEVVILDKTVANYEPERLPTEFIGAVQFLCDQAVVPLVRRGPGCRTVVVPALKARKVTPLETPSKAGTEAQILAWFEINHAKIEADRLAAQAK